MTGEAHSTSHLQVLRQSSVVSEWPNTALWRSVGANRDSSPEKVNLRKKGIGKGKPRAILKDDSLKFKKKKSRKGEKDKNKFKHYRKLYS